MERETHRIVADLIVIPAFPILPSIPVPTIASPAQHHHPHILRVCIGMGLDCMRAATKVNPLQAWPGLVPSPPLLTTRERAGSEALSNPVWLLGLLLDYTPKDSEAVAASLLGTPDAVSAFSAFSRSL